MLYLLYIIVACILLYLLLSLFFTYLVHRFPRDPIKNPPDWGNITDTIISTHNGGFLEVWKITPSKPSRATILFAHGWGSNRDKMVDRARIFAEFGYEVIIHSFRDHGKSSQKKIVCSIHFADDIEALLEWIEKPVILYGYSAGAAASIIAAQKNPKQVKLLFLEACFANTEEALLSFYRYVNKFFGIIFGPSIVFLLKLFYGRQFKQTYPGLIAPNLKMPVMLIHGECDRQFPLKMALLLKESFKIEQIVEMFIARGKDHGDSYESDEYKIAIKNFLDLNNCY